MQIAISIAMGKLFSVFAASLLFGCGTLLGAGGESISPPFDLSWGATRTEIEDLITKANLQPPRKETVEEKEIWTVQGFDQPGLTAVLFYFSKESLTEVELQYGDPAWNLARYAEFINEVKQDLDLKYGRAQVLSHTREPEKDVSQTVVAYRWQQPEQALDLVFYSAEREPQAFRLLSLHYQLVPAKTAAEEPLDTGKVHKFKKKR